MLRDVVFTTIALAMAALARLAFNTAALNAFGDAALGRLSVAFSVAMLLALPCVTGLALPTLRYVAQARGQGRDDRMAWTIRRMLVWTVGGVVLTSVVAAHFAQDLAELRNVNGALMGFAIALSVVYVLYQFFRNVMYGINRVGLYARLEVIGGVLFFVGLAVLCLGGNADWVLLAFLIPYGTVALGSLVQGAWPFLARTPTTHASPLPWRNLASFSVFSMIGASVSLCVREVVVFMAPAAAGLEGAAYLALSLSLLMPMQAAPRLLRTVVFAHSAAMDGGGNRAGMRQTITEANHWLFLVTVPLCGLFMVFGDVLFSLVGGTPTPHRVWALQLLAAATCVEVIATPTNNALPGIGEIRTPTFAALLGLCLASAVWWMGTPSWGLPGLALGLFVSSVTKSMIPVVLARRRWGFRLTRTPLRATALVAACALGALASQSPVGPWWTGAAYTTFCGVLVFGPARQLISQILVRFKQTRRSGAP